MEAGDFFDVRQGQYRFNPRAEAFLKFFNGLGESLRGDRFEQVIKGVFLKGLQRISIISGYEDDGRHDCLINHAQQLKAVNDRHLHVE